MTQELEELLVSEYNKGVSIRQLALKYKISRPLISKVLKNQNIMIRTTVETSRKFSCNEHYFDIIDTEEKAYWLGFIAADGCVQIHKYYNTQYLNVTLSNVDKQHLLKLKYALSATNELKEYKGSGYNANGLYVRLLISSHILVNALLRQGILYNKTNKLLRPNLDKNLIRHYIRGYVDGNGSIFINGEGYVQFSITGSLDVLRYINEYFGSVNKIAYIKGCYSVIYKGTKAIKYLHKIYSDSVIYLDRKFQYYMNCCG